MGTPYQATPEAKARALATLKQELATRVERLELARRMSGDASALVKQLKAEHDALIADQVERDKNLKLQLGVAEDELKALAFDIYRLEPDSKQILPGVSIAVSRKARFKEAAALAWATAKGLFIVPAKLDEKALGTFLLNTPEAAHDFKEYEIVEELQARIATDLTLTLEAARRIAADTTPAPAPVPADESFPF